MVPWLLKGDRVMGEEYGQTVDVHALVSSNAFAFCKSNNDIIIPRNVGPRE